MQTGEPGMGKDPWQVPDHDKKAPQTQLDENWRQDLHHYAPNNRVHQPKVVRLIVFLVGMAMLVFGLSLAFPITAGIDPYLVRSLVIIVIFGGAAVFWSRASLMKIAKVAGLWTFIIAGLSVFYLSQSELGNRFMSSIDPAGVTSTGEGLMVHRSRDGHFWLRIQMNGVPLRFMVDTGASNVVLSPQDAKNAGFPTHTLKFNGVAQTANGSVPYARATATSLQVGDLTFYDVPITVNGAKMDGSLLGMSVLKRFSSIEFRGDTLILRP